MKLFGRFSLTYQIIAAMILGGAAGYLFQESVAPLGVLGTLVIQLIKALAIPLVFFAIIDAIITTHIPAKSAGRLFVIVAINGAIAATIGLTLSNVIQPGSNLQFMEASKGLSGTSARTFETHPLEFGEVLSGYVPKSFVAPFIENNIIAVVILAILFGAAIRRVKSTSHGMHIRIDETVIFIFKLFEQMLTWLVRLVPLAVFGVMCKTVGEYGFSPFKGLAIYVIVAIAGMMLHIALVYQAWIAYYCKLSLKEFWGRAKKPLAYAFGVNSSLATLPLTLHALDELGVRKSASRLGACVGTNLNNDGILLYEAMAVLFVCQAYGLELSFGEQLSTVLLCVVAAIGVAGIPEAGVVSLSLVLSTVGISLEILPLLLTVDWLVARMRSVTNVMADMTVSLVLDRGEGPSVASAPK